MEGAIEEVKVILGWTYDTHSLIISLPNQKYTAWAHNLEQLMLKGTSSHSELDTIIGRLSHVAYVILPLGITSAAYATSNLPCNAAALPPSLTLCNRI